MFSKRTSCLRNSFITFSEIAELLIETFLNTQSLILTLSRLHKSNATFSNTTFFKTTSLKVTLRKLQSFEGSLFYS